MSNYSSQYGYGVIAGGMVDGSVNIWNPLSIMSSGDDPLLVSIDQHQGSVSALHFNPHSDSSHLLATGGSDGEVFVISLDRLDPPSVFLPAPPPNNAKHTADITQVAWNSQVAHILASSALNGSCFIWDLRQKRAWCELRDPSGGSIADVAWNPDQGLHIVTASGDDKNPVLKLWDLRSSTSLPLATLQGHSEGILSVSWCPSDPTLLLSCGKDNRTIVWDLFQLQPVYELPFKQAATSHSEQVFDGFATSASHRRYHVSWSPCLPAVISASSFDRKIQFFSTTGFRSKTGKAPKWLRRPVSACFGFGGKLVMTDNRQTGDKPSAKKGQNIGKLRIFQCMENPEIVQTSDEFHKAVTKSEFKELCEHRADSTLHSNQVWKLMKVICFGTNAREELLSYLGFDSSSISAAATGYTPSSSVDLTSVDAADVFAAVAETVVENKSSSEADRIANLSPDSRLRYSQLLETLFSSESAEPLIRRSLIVGNFEMAVDCCLKAGMLAEALLLAQCGGQDLRVKTQAAFFERQRKRHPFLNILHAVIKSQLMDFVLSSDLGNWKETLALLSTYGKSEEFSILCEALAARLEKELLDTKSAALCYMCAANVPQTIRFWTEELNDANRLSGQLNIAELQDYVEKILVFTHVNPVEDFGIECGQYFARFADILANQGRLTDAAMYLKGDSLPIRVLSDRIYHAGTKPAGSRPPPFPFSKNYVDNGSVPTHSGGVQVSASNPKQTDTASRLVVNSTTSSNKYPTTSQTPAPVAPSILPHGWIQLVDPVSQKPYFANQITGLTQWEPPSAGSTTSDASADRSVPHHSHFSEHPASSTVAHPSNTGVFPAETVGKSFLTGDHVSATLYVPTPEGDCVVALGQMIEAIAGKSLLASLNSFHSVF
jgi:protein transport protein SEC31